MSVMASYKNKDLGIKVSAYIDLCLWSVSRAHFLHLVTKSYAEHMALDEFYSEFPEHLDRVAETAMGKGLMLTQTPVVGVQSAVVLMDDLLSSGNTLVGLLSKEPDTMKGVVNAVEDSLEFITKIRYKLIRFE